MLEKLFEEIIRYSTLIRTGECLICLEPIIGVPSGCKIACGHRFHRTCIRKWAFLRSNCPYCRARCYPHSPLITNIWHWTDLARYETELIEEFERICTKSFPAVAPWITRDYLPPRFAKDPWRFLVLITTGTPSESFAQVTIQNGSEVFMFYPSWDTFDARILTPEDPYIWLDDNSPISRGQAPSSSDESTDSEDASSGTESSDSEDLSPEEPIVNAAPRDVVPEGMAGIRYQLLRIIAGLIRPIRRRDW